MSAADATTTTLGASTTVGSVASANAIVGADLTVDYPTSAGVVRALDCRYVSIDGGTSLAIMGESGCGKSTLLGLLAGLAVPTTGTVTIGDVTVSELAERDRVRLRRRALGMVYQADNLLPHLTVEENVGLQLAICGQDRNGHDRSPSAQSARSFEDPAALLERLGLGELAKRFPDQLSGGQRQRVAVARAIVHRPAVILADEPTGALDDDSARRVIELLVEVHREMSASLVIVTHDPEIARHADRTVNLARPAHVVEPSHAH